MTRTNPTTTTAPGSLKRTHVDADDDATVRPPRRLKARKSTTVLDSPAHTDCEEVLEVVGPAWPRKAESVKAPGLMRTKPPPASSSAPSLEADPERHTMSSSERAKMKGKQAQLLPPTTYHLRLITRSKAAYTNQAQLEAAALAELVLAAQEEYAAKLQDAHDKFELRTRSYEARLEVEKSAYEVDIKRREAEWQRHRDEFASCEKNMKDEFEVRQKEMRNEAERRLKDVEEKLAAEERLHAALRSEIEILKEENAILVAERELSERKARVAALRAQHYAT